MSFLKAVDACRNLFSISSMLAYRVLPTLRLEDIKIALAKQLHKVKIVNSSKKTTNPNLLIKNYGDLAEYIQKNNLDVFLALESNRKPASDEKVYLYPIAKNTEVNFSKHASILLKKDIYFKGNLPPRKLRFSTFLYYKGFISYYDVMESIAWQKDRRPLLGQMAMQIGYLTIENFAQTVVFVKNGKCFGEMARKKNYLSDNLISIIVKAQEKYDCKIGKYFIEKELFSHDRILELHQEMINHNSRYN